MDATTKAPTFEVEAGSMDQFLSLLEMRELGEAPKASYEVEERSALRRAVFVSELLDAKGTQYGWPIVRRYVLASFAYGVDRVFYVEETSREMEVRNMPGMKELPERQRQKAEEIRAEIAGRIEERGWEIPLLEGHLRHTESGGAPS